MKTVEIFITGRVQKVGFRACVRKIATDLSVTGSVFNLPDGRVQVYATAEPMILEKFISIDLWLPAGGYPRRESIRNPPHDV